MIEVTKDQFYKAIGGPENNHPTAKSDRSDWFNLSTRQLVGRTEPGYKSPHGTPHRYWLIESLAMRVKPATDVRPHQVHSWTQG